MKSISTATRLSVSLACLTTSVLFAAQSVGLIPDGQAAAMKGRKDLCETVAIYCSLAAQRNDNNTIRQAAEAIRARNPQVVSLAVRRNDGRVMSQTPGHERHWNQGGTKERSTSTHVQVPIFQGPRRWGTVEIVFRPIIGTGIGGFIMHPLIRLAIFVAALGFAAYLFYLRKTLRHLDPTAVIPERVKAMLDTLTEGVLVLDKHERIVLANDAFFTLSGIPAGELMGQPVAELGWSLPGTDASADAAEVNERDGKKRRKLKAIPNAPWSKAVRDGDTERGVPMMLRPESGPPRAVTVNCAPVLAAAGKSSAIRGALLTVDDVTQLEAKNNQLRDTLQALEGSRDEIQRQNKELHALATTDPLTGCVNRRSFYHQFQTLWATAKRYDQSVGCIMVDVDHFKKINDRHGHSVGDQVLQHVAMLLKGLARETDVVCRYGGEEFCILLPLADITAAAQAAERYREAIEKNPCGNVSPTASVGATALHLGAGAPHELVDEADKALYVAKRTGRNRVVRWDEVRGNPDIENAGKRAGEPPAPALVKRHTPIASHAVTALMSALAHRDRRTAEHCQRVADLCAITARGLLSAHECFVLEVAAMLHDIGKLGVPDAVLLKPGSLTEAEWEVMRSHDQMGVEIISAAFGSAHLSDIVRLHHAWFGGNPNLPANPGEPAGAEIPVAARVLAIADAYDAIVSDRPYRAARAEEDAFNELRRCVGTQFDPELTERFIHAVTARRKAAATELPPESGLAPTVSPEAALRIRLEIERLVCAAEAEDAAALSQIARELAATAAGDGLPVLADQVAEVERASGEARLDIDRIRKLTDELLEVCRSPESIARAAASCENTTSGAKK